MRHLTIHQGGDEGSTTVMEGSSLVAAFTRRADAERFVIAVAVEEFRASIEEDVERGTLDR